MPWKLLESDDVQLMGMTAGHLTRKQFGKKASFVNNIILNYTNVCITDCKFCAFYRSPDAEGSYTLTLEEIEARMKTSVEMFHIRQVLIQGPKPPPERITLTRPVLATARHTVLLATGLCKRSALERLRAGDPSLPAHGLPGLTVVTELDLGPDSGGRR